MRFSLSIIALGLLCLSTFGLAVRTEHTRRDVKSRPFGVPASASSLHIPSDDSLARISRLRESRLSMPFEELEPISPYRKPIRTFRAQGMQYGGKRTMRTHRGKGLWANSGRASGKGKGASGEPHRARIVFGHEDAYESY